MVMPTVGTMIRERRTTCELTVSVLIRLGSLGPGLAGNVVVVSEQRRCILTVHAHPDDEASKGAPTLAMYHAQGVHTVLVCCTGGEEGDVQNPALREEGGPFFGLTPEQEKVKMAELRPAELAASAAIIGFDETIMLGYRDSGMLDSEPNNHAESFNMAPIDEAVGRLVAVIRRTRPQIIITYSDDHSGYPHPDHVKVNDISVLAFERAGDSTWYPDAGEPYQPAKMYYTIWSRARFLKVHEAMLRIKGSSPFDEKWFERPDNDDKITTKLDVGAYLWARTESLRAHATQVDPTAAWWFGLNDDELAEAYPYEDWALAASHVGPVPPIEPETDLFEGIDVPVGSTRLGAS